MPESSIVYKESLLYEYWIKNDLKKDVYSFSGETIEILNRGELNSDTAGPDFKNARIKFGNIVYVGDVEIDFEYRDWKYHGHSRNKRYNHVILHLYFNNSTNHADYVYTESGRKIPSLNIYKLIKNIPPDLKTFSENKPLRDETDHLICKWVFSQPNVEAKLDFIHQLGMQKFKRKCERLIERIRELLYLQENGINEPFLKYEIPKEFYEKQFSYNEINNRAIWEQLLYESVFEALGYPLNKDSMIKLSRYANLNFLRKVNSNENIVISYESSLLFISGIAGKYAEKNLGDPYIRKITETWHSVRTFYDGNTLNEREWHFYKMRPQNFPTLRVAGGARIVDSILNKELISVLVKKFTEINSDSVLINSVRNCFLQKAEGFWEKHYTMDKPAKTPNKMLIGVNRADEIVLNVILPFMYVYFLLFNKTDLAKKTLSVFSNSKLKLDNSIVREMAKGLMIENQYDKSVIYLGLLELFRNYCSRERCGECAIGDHVFSEN